VSAARRKKPREASVEAHFVKRVKELGGEVRKVRWIGRRDAPDRRAMFPGGFGVVPSTRRVFNFWAELKRPGKDATESQAREHERMRMHGEIVVVLNSRKAVDEYLGFAS
jgi:hypothetical protein